MAQAQASFSSILDAPASDSTRPPALPQGHYVFLVKGLPRKDKSTKKGTEYIEYTLALMEPYTNADNECDVDAEELASYGDYKGKERRLTFYMTEASAYRHTEFLENDLKVEIGGDSHWEAAQRTGGIQFIAQIRHKAREDGKGVYDEIGNTAPLEA